MTEKTQEREEFRAFTVRVPITQYIAMSDMARADHVHLNKKITQLLLLGMDKHISLDDALRRLIAGHVLDAEVPTHD